MKRTGIMSTTVLALAAGMACGGSGSSSGGGGGTPPPVTPTPTVTSVAVAGNTSLVAGTSAQWTATARLSDGSSQTVTSASGTAWASSNDGTASVSSTGLVTAKAAGSADISATYQAMKGSQSVTVTTPAPVLAADFTVTPDANTGFSAAFQCPVNPEPPNNSLLCRFDGTASTAPGGVSTYTWEIPEGSGNIFNGSVQTDKTIPCGKFGSAGDRSVKLTITSPSGTTSKSRTVTFVKGTPC